MENTQANNRLLGYVLLGLGALFFIGQIFSFKWFGLLWPLFVIAPGAPFLYAALTDESKNGKNAGLIFPGLIIAGTGLILMYQSITGHWESWAYIWTLYPVFVGMGLKFNGERTHSKGEVRTGESMIRYGLMAFAGLAVMFEVFIFGIGGLIGSLWPLLLLGAGVYLLNKNSDGKRISVDVKSKRKYEGPSAEINPELKRKIEDALAEDDDVIAANGKPRIV